jgi:hypothetical protein
VKALFLTLLAALPLAAVMTGPPDSPDLPPKGFWTCYEPFIAVKAGYAARFQLQRPVKGDRTRTHHLYVITQEGIVDLDLFARLEIEGGCGGGWISLTHLAPGGKELSLHTHSGIAGHAKVTWDFFSFYPGALALTATYAQLVSPVHALRWGAEVTRSGDARLREVQFAVTGGSKVDGFFLYAGLPASWAWLHLPQAPSFRATRHFGLIVGGSYMGEGPFLGTAEVHFFDQLEINLSASLKF